MNCPALKCHIVVKWSHRALQGVHQLIGFVDPAHLHQLLMLAVGKLIALRKQEDGRLFQQVLLCLAHTLPQIQSVVLVSQLDDCHWLLIALGLIHDPCLQPLVFLHSSLENLIAHQKCLGCQAT